LPRYVYVCKKCEKEFNIVHSIADKLKTCQEVNRECDLDGELERKPSFFFTTNNIQSEERVGDVVKNSIEGFKEDLKTEKQQLTGKDYKEND
tara:strand:+ start:103 stop:378 length:276 start_codon:yes stop_codon:yes gene_type:complete